MSTVGTVPVKSEEAAPTTITDDPSAQVPASDETPSDADETPVSEDTGEETPTASGEGEEAAEDEGQLADLDDETLEALADVYGDRFLKSKTLQDRIDRAIQSQVERRVRDHVQTTDQQDEVTQLVEKGKYAVNSLAALAEGAKAELSKAAQAQDFSAEVFDPRTFMGHLSDYGQSIVAEVSLRYDRALQGMIANTLAKVPTLTEAQTQEFRDILQTATRMENDQRQAPQAKNYFVASVTGFLLDRAFEAGAVAERARLTKQSNVGKKIADANAVKAAKAKLAAEGNVAPRAPAGTPVSTKAPTGAYDSAYYRTLKRDGKHEEAQRYVDRFAGSAAAFAR